MNHSAPIHTTLIGVPLNLGANNLGVEMGPNAYRYRDIVPKLQQAGFAITDAGNVSVKERWLVNRGTNQRLSYLDEIIRISEDTAHLVHQAIDKDQRVIVLGGDHTTCLGAVSGASVAVDGDIGLIYIDAHGDMNTDQTTPTGNIHGMQLASLMGFGHQSLSRVHGDQVKVAKQHVLHIAGCDWDKAELDLVSRENIATFTIADLLEHGMSPLLPMIKKLQSQVKHVWISLDLDSIDAQSAPAAGMPNKKGLLYREITTLAQYIGANCNVLGVDVVEYNPLIDIESKTADLAIELIGSLFNRSTDWYAGHLARNPLQ